MVGGTRWSGVNASSVSCRTKSMSRSAAGGMSRIRLMAVGEVAKMTLSFGETPLLFVIVLLFDSSPGTRDVSFVFSLRKR